MVRTAAILGVALAVLVTASHAASAGGIVCTGWAALLDPLCWLNPGNPGSKPNPAPAPLLAAGVPAFVALGGGVLVTRLRNKFRRRA
jgi:hypothetical protein